MLLLLLFSWCCLQLPVHTDARGYVQYFQYNIGITKEAANNSWVRLPATLPAGRDIIQICCHADAPDASKANQSSATLKFDKTIFELTTDNDIRGKGITTCVIATKEKYNSIQKPGTVGRVTCMHKHPAGSSTAWFYYSMARNLNLSCDFSSLSSEMRLGAEMVFVCKGTEVKQQDTLQCSVFDSAGALIQRLEPSSSSSSSSSSSVEFRLPSWHRSLNGTVKCAARQLCRERVCNGSIVQEAWANATLRFTVRAGANCSFEQEAGGEETLVRCTVGVGVPPAEQVSCEWLSNSRRQTLSGNTTSGSDGAVVHEFLAPAVRSATNQTVLCVVQQPGFQDRRFNYQPIPEQRATKTVSKLDWAPIIVALVILLIILLVIIVMVIVASRRRHTEPPPKAL